MFRPTRAASALLLSTLIGLQLYAQEIQRAKPGDNQAEPSGESNTIRNGKRALALLDQLLETSNGFADSQLKIEIQAEIADLFWPRDERRARRMFEEALRGVDGIKLTHLDADASNPFIAGIKSRMRTEMLRKISRRDRDLAEKLAKSIEQAPPNEPKPPPLCLGCRNQNESDTQQLQLALATIDIDKARAAELAKAGLSKGINPMISSVLWQMRRKDPALADELFVYALSVARRHSTYLSESFGSLFGHVLPELGTGMMKRIAAAQPAVAPANPAMITEFLNFVHDAVVHEADALQSREANAADPQANRRIAYDYFIGEQTLPYFERYLPDKTAAVRARLEDILRAVPPEAARQYLADFKSDHAPEASLNQAKTETNTATQQSLYQRAITEALNAQDYDQALDLITKLEDEAARFFESQVRYQQAMVAMSKGDFDAAYEYANEVPDLSMRALLLGRSIALELFDKEETLRAAQVLAEAEALFQTAESGVDKARGMVELVYASAQMDLDLGFKDMRLAVDAINAAGFAPQWMSFKTLISQKTGRPFVRVDVGIDDLRFDMGFGDLARHDFDRALQLAQMIASKEVSVLAQVAVCRIALDQMPASSPLEKTKEKDQPAARKKKPSAQG